MHITSMQENENSKQNPIDAHTLDEFIFYYYYILINYCMIWHLFNIQ